MSVFQVCSCLMRTAALFVSHLAVVPEKSHRSIVRMLNTWFFLINFVLDKALYECNVVNCIVLPKGNPCWRGNDLHTLGYDV